jgi:hypothetical protein
MGDTWSSPRGDQVMDGPGFRVDLDKLDEAATGIRQSIDDQDNFELRLTDGAEPVCEAMTMTSTPVRLRRRIDKWTR